MAAMRVAIVAVVVSSLVALCSGFCTAREPVAHIETQDGVPVLVSSGCLDEHDKPRKEGDEWQTSDCMRCSCSSETVTCCSIAFRPVMGFPASCEPILDTKKCVYTVVKKKNHKVKCPLSGPQAAVG
ncbi:beta-microseminoprotein-like [Petromyzon marinus]|uniref:Beta-microseminoprotein-like n=1 Tax=Petromyzon marinus TaxID=7757 RepID=A0AAJ7SWF4_PETMA|nr:beta-microseminoprotein-like [Petromyzon marinus]